MTAKQARVVMSAVAIVAALEWSASARVYRDRIEDADWAAAREAIPEGEAVAIAEAWLGPRARMEVPALARVDNVARPDLHGMSRLHVLGLDRAWSDELDRDLEGLPRPQPQSQQDIGPFTLTTYALPGKRVLADFVHAALRVRTDSACKGRDGTYRCTEGSVVSEIAEIEYRPRACLAFALADGIAGRVRHEAMPLGDELRGHVGFHDYNGRIRNDTPARVVVSIDDTIVARFLVSDEEGWRAFTIPTTPGTANVEVEVTVGVQATWGKNGLDATYPRRACLELRSLEAP